MASQVSPGVVLKERELSNAVVVGAQEVTAAFASTFAKGPIGEITTIASERELIATFGRPVDSNAEDWLVASEFLNYGGRLAVVRAETGVQNAANGGGLLIANETAWESGVGSAKVLAARSAGSHGNSLKVVIVDRGADQVITLASAPTTSPSAGDQVVFNLSGGGTANAELVAISGAELTVILDDPTRLITTADEFEDGATDLAVSSVADWYTTTTIGSTGLTLGAIAPRPGTSSFAASRGISYDEVHIAVIDTTGDVSGAANTIVERLTYLSKLSDAKSDEGGSIYFKEVINSESSYIFHGAAPTVSQEPASTGSGVAWNQASSALSSGDKHLLGMSLETDLSGGTDDYAYTSGEVGAGYDLFGDSETSAVNFVLMGGSMATETDTVAKAQKVIAIASGRKDCVAFVSPHKGNQVGTSAALTTAQQKVNTINFFNQLASTSYAVFDSGYKYFYDRFNDKYRWLPCNADVAGLCVATSATLDDWFSPAGLNRGAIRNAIKLAYNPTKADRDELYQVRINPVITLPGTGTVLFGDKTALSSPSAFDRINVRRLFLNIEKRVETLAKGVLFELNDTTTRALFSSAVNSYMNEVQARRGVTDYLVVCDESNNTPDVVDRNEFVAEIYIKPTRSINYVTVTFTATKTGVSFSEVVGR